MGVGLSIWETADNSGFDRFRYIYWRGAWIVYLVFDVTNRSSFESLPSQVAMDGLNDDTYKFSFKSILKCPHWPDSLKRTLNEVKKHRKECLNTTYSCAICLAIFEDRRSLIAHQSRIDGTCGYMCLYCHAHFGNNQHALAIHLKRHLIKKEHTDLI